MEAEKVERGPHMRSGRGSEVWVLEGGGLTAQQRAFKEGIRASKKWVKNAFEPLEALLLL
jgi:hypothetical protein